MKLKNRIDTMKSEEAGVYKPAE